MCLSVYKIIKLLYSYAFFNGFVMEKAFVRMKLKLCIGLFLGETEDRVKEIF